MNNQMTERTPIQTSNTKSGPNRLISDNTMKRLYTKTKIDSAWFSRLLRHPASKRNGSILTTRSPHEAVVLLRPTR